MKTNTTDAKRLIEQAIKAMPQDFALNEVRHHLKAALGHINHVEEKRVRREAVQRQNELNAKFSSMGGLPNGSVDLRENLKIIDDLIAAENKKLEEIVAKRQSRTTPRDVEPREDDLIRD